MFNDPQAASPLHARECGLCRIYLIEPQTIMRAAIRTMVDSSEQFTVVGESGTAEQALEQLRLLQPDMVLTELLPARTHREFLYKLRACSPRTAIVVLTERLGPERMAVARKAGARAFVLKQCGRAELFAAIQKVCAGGGHMSAPQQETLGPTTGHGPSGLGRTSAGLTERQHEVLRSIALGLCTSEIASALGVSLKAVQRHRDQIRYVLNLRSTAALTAYAIREGLVTN
ncbi:MAG: DNA-binding response regulator [Gammaproteobacteria bacterium]|nr:DNA-binding response regulator [Gammaproteobacteria bacterium]